MTAPLCPHRSAPVRGDGRPACLCAAVDADGFDPLRVRPYVSLPDATDEDTGGRPVLTRRRARPDPADRPRRGALTRPGAGR